MTKKWKLDPEKRREVGSVDQKLTNFWVSIGSFRFLHLSLSYPFLSVGQRERRRKERITGHNFDIVSFFLNPIFLILH